MRCGSCGASVAEGNFCQFCGARLNAKKAARQENVIHYAICVVEDDGEYSAFDTNQYIDTDDFSSKRACLEQAKAELLENYDGEPIPTENDVMNDKAYIKLQRKCNVSVEFLEIPFSELKAAENKNADSDNDNDDWDADWDNEDEGSNDWDDDINTDDDNDWDADDEDDSWDSDEDEDGDDDFFTRRPKFGINAKQKFARETSSIRNNAAKFGRSAKHGMASEDESSPVYAYIEQTELFFNGDVPNVSFCAAPLCDSYDECLAQLKKNFKEAKSHGFYKPPKQNLNELKRQHPNAKFIRLD